MTDAAPTRVVVEVDQVVLHGRDVSHHDVVRFRAALATELGRLFGGTTLLAGWREPGRIHAWDQLALSLPTLPADGDGLGRTTARAVHGAVPDLAPPERPAIRSPEVRP